MDARPGVCKSIWVSAYSAQDNKTDSEGLYAYSHSDGVAKV